MRSAATTAQARGDSRSPPAIASPGGVRTVSLPSARRLSPKSESERRETVQWPGSSVPSWEPEAEGPPQPASLSQARHPMRRDGKGPFRVRSANLGRAPGTGRGRGAGGHPGPLRRQAVGGRPGAGAAGQAQDPVTVGAPPSLLSDTRPSKPPNCPRIKSKTNSRDSWCAAAWFPALGRPQYGCTPRDPSMKPSGCPTQAPLGARKAWLTVLGHAVCRQLRENLPMVSPLPHAAISPARSGT